MHTTTGLPFVLDVDASRTQPLVLQIVEAIVDAVRKGRLPRGTTLPGARTLAASLGVDRGTVDVAIDELEAQGVLLVRPRRRPRVVGLPARLAQSAMPTAAAVGFDIGRVPSVEDDSDTDPPDAIALWGGTPDVSLLPREALVRAWRDAVLGRHGETLLGYGDARGVVALREQLALLLRESRGIAASADDVLVTRGAQMALDLVARTFVAAGDVVVVEDPCYPPARAAFAARGARIVPLAVDGDGIDVEGLARLLLTTPVRAIVLTPHHQYPTTVTLSAARRQRLLALCARRRVLVVEDDYDHEFHYGSRPRAPLLADDVAGVVVSIGSLSKLLAPGLRLGWITGPRDAIDALVRTRRFVDRQGDHVLEQAVATLLADGDVARHARRMRRVYRRRRDLLVEQVRTKLDGAASCDVPDGGMALWLRIADDVDLDRWVARARTLGVVLQPTRSLYGDGHLRQQLRVGFAGNSEERLVDAIDRLAQALPR
jgi:GntR family transcriptional regulator/MocR family aminotransferase